MLSGDKLTRAINQVNLPGRKMECAVGEITFQTFLDAAVVLDYPVPIEGFFSNFSKRERIFSTHGGAALR